MRSSPFAALLLTGGRSQRMGQDKALLDWHGRPLWTVQVQKLQALNPQRLLIACRQEQGLHGQRSAQGADWLFDPPQDALGPLGAIMRALAEVQMPLLVLAVALPNMTEEFLQTKVLPHRGAGKGFFFESEHGFEPMASLYVPAMLPVMCHAVNTGHLGLQGVIKQSLELDLVQVGHASSDQRKFFVNTNTLAEWEHEKGRSN